MGVQLLPFPPALKSLLLLGARFFIFWLVVWLWFAVSSMKFCWILSFLVGIHAQASTSKNVSTSLSFGEAVLAGAGARLFAQTFMHPLEVVRTRTQAFRGRTMPILPLSAKFVLALKGIVPQILLAGPAGALQFGALEVARAWLLKHAPPALVAGTLSTLWAGFFGAFIAASVRIPQEVLKQGCQADVYSNCLVALSTIWRLSGLAGLYRGAGVTLARDILWNGLSYAFFSNWKVLFARVTHRESSASENLLIGAAGGSLAALFTQPLDVAKTRIMIQRAGEVAKYKGVFATVLLLLKEEGPLVLFSGLLTRVVYLAPFASLVYAANDFLKKQLLAAKNRQEL